MTGLAERRRLDEARDHGVPWRLWGPYLSERQWGTVREDYSENGDAWNYFTHDQARSRAYRWGEDGMAGISDDRQQLCFAVAMWNGNDPILKERLFGLANSEGNHGEDVKEYYFYLDSTPTHSYMKYLYKYPQAAYPYDQIVATNRARGRNEPEYELLDTGVFDGGRYFDVFVEYAKAAHDDVLVRISVSNRGPEPATLHLLPTLWFRNTWSWQAGSPRPLLSKVPAGGLAAVHARHSDPAVQESLGDYILYCDANVPLLFTENESNSELLFGQANASPYVKDAFHRHLVGGDATAVNPDGEGTKAAAHYTLVVDAGQTRTIRLRLAGGRSGGNEEPFGGFAAVFTARQKEADAFYRALTPPSVQKDPDRANVLRQALSGMLWGKQYFYYDLERWLTEHGAAPSTPPAQRARVRNADWSHMHNDDIISMPDKWEYPWYAAWDLAFHMIPLGIVDPEFAKHQLDLMLRNDYLHPNGQLPAYEWNFGDVNPPVHAWATMQLYQLDTARTGTGDVEFLKYAFSKLLVNFTWWVNRKDRAGANVFDGGFLGLDNIGVFDRSSPLPTGGYLDQADGTAWMVFFSQSMLRIAVELALHEPLYVEFVEKFFQHTLFIAGAMDRLGERKDEMWDEEDGFFYDVLRMPDGSAVRLKVRSLVGLLPLAAVAVFEEDILARLPGFAERARAFLERHADLAANIHLPSQPGQQNRRMLSIVDERKLRRLLARMLDENEFFGPHGIRALSRYHLEHPYVFFHGRQEYRVAYVPGDSDSGMFGGNSNWRGPVWMPMNFLLYTALLRLYSYYGDEFKVECPTGSGRMATLLEVARELGERLAGLFLRDPATGARPANGTAKTFDDDPHWRDLVLFYEYFHGDTGAGIGASHQTGWTGCVARIIQLNAIVTPKMLLMPNAESALAKALQPVGKDG